MDIRDEYGRIVRNPQAFDPTARKLATERLENLFFDAFEAFEDAAFAAREFDAELSRLIVGAGMAICQRIEAAHALSPEQAKEEDYDINGRTAVCG